MTSETYNVYKSHYDNLEEQYHDLEKRLSSSTIFYYREGNQLLAYEKINNKRSNEQTFSFSIMDEFMGKASSTHLANFLREFKFLYNDLFKYNKSYKDYMRNILKFMFLFSELNYGSLQSGMLSYCSHSEGFFTKSSRGKVFKEKFETNLQKNLPLLKKILNSRSEYTDKEKYLKLIKNLKSDVRDSISKGDILFLNLDSDLKMEGSLLNKSEFHRNLSENKAFMKYMTEDTEFLTKRYMTILQYMFLKSVGLDEQERYYFCYLCYRTIEEEYSIEALSAISQTGGNS